MYAFFACGGKSVSNKSHVCDDWIDVPLGMFTFSGMCDVCFMVHGDVADRKILVHPESILSVPSAASVKIVGVQSKVNANCYSCRSITLAAPEFSGINYRSVGWDHTAC
jgi:hypothetical protein